MFQWAKNAIYRYQQYPNGIGPLTKKQADKISDDTLKDGRIHRWFCTLDVAINGLFLNGIVNETISSHIGRAAYQHKAWGIFMAKFLNLFEWNHVAQAIAADRGRGRNVVGLEDAYLQKDEN